MSAVSSESPRSSADLAEQANGRSGAPPARPAGQDGASQAPPAQADGTATDFGPNEWLVDELYQRYQADPSSVDRAWWNFFADYHPLPPRPPRAAPRQDAGGPAAAAGPAQQPTGDRVAGAVQAAGATAAPGTAPAGTAPAGTAPGGIAPAGPAPGRTASRRAGAAAPD